MTQQTEPREEQLNRMRSEQLEREGEECNECGGRVVTDRTPSYVFKQMDLCECGDPCEGKEHDFAPHCPTCSGRCMPTACAHCEMSFEAELSCITCGVPQLTATP